MEKFIIDAEGISDKGIVKQINQDNILLKSDTLYGEDIYLFAVCDGVGGLSKGEIASEICIEELESWWKSIYLLRASTIEEIKESLFKNLEEINLKIYEYSIKNNMKMGTTASIIFFYRGEYCLVHVGDSRIYNYRRKLSQLTEDHSYIAMKLRNREITKEEAKNSKIKNLLLQCVGTRTKIEVYSKVGQVKGEETFLLGSDGFYNKLEENEIKEMLLKWRRGKEFPLKNLVLKFINLVKERKEKDNISLIIVDIESKEKSFLKRIFK